MPEANGWPSGSGALARECPKCRAKPGHRCRNYKGQACAPHRERMRPELAQKPLDNRPVSADLF
jgi:hypothetical protein